MATYLWTADTVMYDGVSMDRAYSGDTLIWCKTCPTQIVGLEEVYAGTGIVKGQDYVIGNRNDGGWWLMSDGKCSGVLQYAMVLHADDNYPPVFHDECMGYVTDLGMAFGLRMGGTTPTFMDYGYTFGAKTRFGSYIKSGSTTIVYGNYNMMNYYHYSPTAGGTRNNTGFKFNGSSTGSSYTDMRLYRIIYGYQE